MILFVITFALAVSIESYRLAAVIAFMGVLMALEEVRLDK